MPSKITLWKQLRGIATSRMLGRLTGGTGQAEELSSTDVRNWLSVYTIAQIDSGSLTFAALPRSSAVPTIGSDLTNKLYVDTFAAGLTAKVAVRVATTVAGTLATSFENGDTIDGIVLATSDRILIKDQSAGAENGVYTVAATGAPTRATDSDTSAEVLQGTFMLVLLGTANSGRQFVQATVSPTLGTSSLVYTQLSAPTVYTSSLGVQLVGADFRSNFVANDGLVLSTNSLTVAYDNSSIGISSNLLAVKALGVTNAMLAGSIADNKLSQITAANKVSGLALSSLGSITVGAGLVPAANLGTGTPSVTTFLRGDGTYAVPAGSGTGDMLLATTQTNTAAKTFNDTTLLLRNVANTFNGSFVNTNTANRVYTLKDAAGTVAFVADITGTNSGTNTGDQTISLTGNVTGSGVGSFVTTIGAAVVTNAMLAGSITASKLVGTDIVTVGTVTAGTWSTGAVIGPATVTLGSDATGDTYYRNASGVLTRLAIGTVGQVQTVAGGLPSWAAASSGALSDSDKTRLVYGACG